MKHNTEILSKNHTFKIFVEDIPIVHLKASLSTELYRTISIYSIGFLRIETKGVMGTLKRLKKMTNGEIELLDIIRKTLKETELSEAFIIFRR